MASARAARVVDVRAFVCGVVVLCGWCAVGRTLLCSGTVCSRSSNYREMRERVADWSMFKPDGTANVFKNEEVS